MTNNEKKTYVDNRISVLLLPKYGRLAASSRHRMYQYMPYLESENIECECHPLFDNTYLERYFSNNERSIYSHIKYYLKRLWLLRRANQFDIVIIHTEILPYFWSIPEKILNLLNIPYILDFDDALFHQYDNHKMWIVRWLFGNKIPSIMRGAQLVIAGNSYISSYAKAIGVEHVEVIPTVVDYQRYINTRKPNTDSSKFIIGWIGSLSTSKYLEDIASALADVCSDGRSSVRLVGAGDVDLKDTPFEILTWDEETEIELIKTFDVGIMPLSDDLWEQGKCGFKLIQYMACGIPVVASPVGANIDIVESGVNGYLATQHEDWVKMLKTLRDDRHLCSEMGIRGKTKVEQQYCIQVTASRMTKIIRSSVWE